MKHKGRGLKKILIFSFALMMLVSFVTNASATNGYFAHGYSVKNKALAGAGTALPLDSLAASNNPAGMVFVGNRIDVGVSFFNPNRQYKVSGAPTTGLMPGVSCNFPGAPAVPGGPACPFGLTPGEEESDSKWFVIPSFGFNWMMNNNYSLGISIYGNGGMNTNYDTNTFNVNSMLPSFEDSPTGVDLSQLFVVPTYARKLNPKHSIGISPIIAYQSFETEGLQAFGEAGFSQDPSKLTNNGHDNSYGIGGRFGYLGEIFPGLFFGASYQTKIYMDKLDDYAGLFAEEGDFDIPSNWSAGVAYHLSGPALIIAFDVQQIFYSDVDSIGNDFTPFNTCFGALLMGGSASSSEKCLGGEEACGDRQAA